MTNLAYVLASIAEPNNPKYSEGDIIRQFDRIGFNSGSKKSNCCFIRSSIKR